MFIFIWNDVDNCSGNYHSNGGVVVFAKDEAKARELANQKEGCKIREDEKPCYIRKTTGTEEKVFIFPNAGCC